MKKILSIILTFFTFLSCNTSEVSVSIFSSKKLIPNNIEKEPTYQLKSDALKSMAALRTITSSEQESAPDNFIKCGSTIVFSANDGVNGTELWKTDSTAGGTVILKDINTGVVSSNPERFFRTAAGYCFFSANTQSDGKELWRTDGTASGTTLVKNITQNSGSTTFSSSFMEIGGGVHLFVADNYITGDELWRTDGTEAGTYLVKDILAGPGNGITSEFRNAKVISGKLMFLANNGVNGLEMWVSDGTLAGTEMLVDTRVGINSSFPSYIVGSGIFNNFYYFSSYDGAGYHLLKTDGDSVITIHSGPKKYGGIIDLENGSAVFAHASSSCDLFLTDGTSGGTSVIRSFNYCYFNSLDPVINNKALLRVDDGTNGVEPWITDGTLGGTQLLADVNPGAGSSFSLYVDNYFKKTLSGLVYFFPRNGDGTEPWITDGTPGGTKLLKDIYVGPSSSDTQILGDYGGGNLLMFSKTAADGGELWITDGTTVGTVSLGDLNPGTEYTLYQPFRPGTELDTSRYGFIDGKLYFKGSNGSFENELGVSDGTAGGTSIIKNINTQLSYFGNNYYNFFNLNNEAYLIDSNDSDYAIWKIPNDKNEFELIKNFNNTIWQYDFVQTSDKIYFLEDDNTRESLWVTDGTSAGTIELVTPRADDYSWATDLKAVGEKVFFIADDNVNGFELWVSDGTVPGSKMVDDTNVGGGNSFDWYGNFFDVNGVAYYWPEYASDNNEDDEPWRSDGTLAGTYILKDINTGNSGSYPDEFTGVGDSVYFIADNNVTGWGLYISDGSMGNADLLIDTSQAGTYFESSIENLKAFGDKLVFSATNDLTGEELSISNGTLGGTQMIKDINPGAGSSLPRAKVMFNEKMIFTANDGTHGNEVWLTDGSEAGTYLLKDIYTGLAGSDCSNFVVYEKSGVFFFTATSMEHGTEIWVSDGTEEGTGILFDIIPGVQSSYAGRLKIVGNRLYFTAKQLNGMKKLHFIDLK